MEESVLELLRNERMSLASSRFLLLTDDIAVVDACLKNPPYGFLHVQHVVELGPEHPWIDRTFKVMDFADLQSCVASFD